MPYSTSFAGVGGSFDGASEWREGAGVMAEPVRSGRLKGGAA